MTQVLKKILLWTTKVADDKFSRFIRTRDPFCFFKCGRPSIQNSHFWGRNVSVTRYDPENCDGVCGHCHLVHENNKQGEYRTRKIAQLGKRRYDALEKRYHRAGVSRVEAIRQVMKLLGIL